MRNILFLSLSLFLSAINVALADVVKPPLSEVTIHSIENRVVVEFNMSIEAVMADIDPKFKNTTESPNSEKYDELRNLEPEVLTKLFLEYEPDFLKSFVFKINGIEIPIVRDSIDVDIIGYNKRARKTLLKYSADLENWPETLSWNYGEGYGEGAFRYRKFVKDEYTWEPWFWLKNGKSTGELDLENPQPQTLLERGLDFVPIGFDHVVPLGWDHILFIIGMALSSLLWRKLIILVSLFTLAHTITLGMSMYGIVEISSYIIEPLIALSISFVAFENLMKYKSDLVSRIIVFGFGLIHGLGFATMLKDFDMTKENLMSTLIGFNVGVELAQLVIVVGVVGILLLLKALKIDHRKWAVIPASILIGTIGLVWGFERIF